MEVSTLRMLTFVNSTLQQRTIKFQFIELVDGKKNIIYSVNLGFFGSSRGNWNGTYVQVIADIVLQLMIYRTLLKTFAQVER